MNLDHLNQQQKQAVLHKNGPALVVAGAGTGKTQVITHRIAYLIKNKLADPSEIVALTFTDKAAREMESRVSELLKTYIFDVNITTFNSFGHELLKRYGLDIGVNSDIKLLNENQQLVFLAEHLDSLNLDYYAPVTNPQALLSELSKYFSQLKDNLIKPASYNKFALNLANKAKEKAEKLEAKKHQELSGAFARYIELCRKHNVIDFDDQIYLAVELLETRPNIVSKLSNQYKQWLIDEFQDTNLAQSRLLDLLVGKQANIMVVGDDDQCIYHFRGAAITNILDFKERYPSAKQIALLQNYRSSQQILDASHQLIQGNNPDRLESRYQINKRLVGQFSHKPPQLKTLETIEQEAEWIAGDIKKRIKQGEDVAEIAILIRKNSSAKYLEKYLEINGVPNVVIGRPEDLFAQTEVRNILRWLQVVADPSRNDELYHLLSSDIYRVDAVALHSLAAKAKREHAPLEELLESLGSDVSGLSEQLKQWRKLMPTLSVGQFCYRFLEDTNYLQRLITDAKDDPSVDVRIRNLNQFFSSLLDFERIASDTTAVGYLANLPSLIGTGERLQLEDAPELIGSKVRILTVHRAKGLEFETVYIFNLSQDTFPARRMSSGLAVPAQLLNDISETATSQQLQEERRLMYVAMTRAKRNLFFTFSFNHGGARPKRPSVFIEEALGSQPVLDQLRTPIKKTNQIELFAHKRIAEELLPATIYQGDQIVLSVAQVQDYLLCPAEFYLRHILQPPTPTIFALSYGTLLHGVIQQYNRSAQNGEKLSLKQLESYLRDNWPKEGFMSQKHRQKGLTQALLTIRRFHKREAAAKRVPAYVEKSFNFRVPSVKLSVNGRFDAVYETSESIEIRDYKTGATNMTTQDQANKRAKDSLQLGIYALAWSYIKGRMPDKLTLDFIDIGLVGEATKTARQLDTVERKLRQVTEGVRAKDFTPGSSHIFCSHMEYGF